MSFLTLFTGAGIGFFIFFVSWVFVTKFRLWKAWFRRDRWKIIKMVHGSIYRKGPYTSFTLRNRYNDRLRLVLKIRGEWSPSDFPDSTWKRPRGAHKLREF